MNLTSEEITAIINASFASVEEFRAFVLVGAAEIQKRRLDLGVLRAQGVFNAARDNFAQEQSNATAAKDAIDQAMLSELLGG